MSIRLALMSPEDLFVELLKIDYDYQMVEEMLNAKIGNLSDKEFAHGQNSSSSRTTNGSYRQFKSERCQPSAVL